GENVLILVAAGICCRLFTKDDPEQPSRSILMYFMVVMGCLALLLKLLPAQPLVKP
ncbi:MAG: hypothetical protein JO041_16395, partial [Acidobacteria bacterium]|nr:hypothetical protein [Acidobacteriota bacterium]